MSKTETETADVMVRGRHGKSFQAPVYASERTNAALRLAAQMTGSPQ
jgi:hypothetical protein